MDLALNGKWALITGASRGLGYACANELAGEGCNLWIGGRSAKHLEQVATQLKELGARRVMWASFNFLDEVSIQEFARQVTAMGESIQAIVISGGGPTAAPTLELSDTEWKEAFQLIVLGPLQLIRSLTPFLSAGASIIFIGAAGVKNPLPNSVLSNSMRAALLVIAKILSQELSGRGIRVNMVLPGPFATERLTELAIQWAASQGISVEEALKERYLKNLSVNHLGDPAELGRLVSFLSSPLTSYVTGTAVTIDGGFSSSLL